MGLPRGPLQSTAPGWGPLKLLFLGGVWSPGFRNDALETAAPSHCSKDGIIGTAVLQQHWKGRQRAEGEP